MWNSNVKVTSRKVPRSRAHNAKKWHSRSWHVSKFSKRQVTKVFVLPIQAVYYVPETLWNWLFWVLRLWVFWRNILKPPGYTNFFLETESVLITWESLVSILSFTGCVNFNLYRFVARYFNSAFLSENVLKLILTLPRYVTYLIFGFLNRRNFWAVLLAKSALVAPFFEFWQHVW